MDFKILALIMKAFMKLLESTRCKLNTFMTNKLKWTVLKVINVTNNHFKYKSTTIRPNSPKALKWWSKNTWKNTRKNHPNSNSSTLPNAIILVSQLHPEWGNSINLILEIRDKQVRFHRFAMYPKPIPKSYLRNSSSSIQANSH